MRPAIILVALRIGMHKIVEVGGIVCLVHELFVFKVFRVLYLFQNFFPGEVNCLCCGFPYGVAFDCGDIESGFVCGVGFCGRLYASCGREEEEGEEEEERDKWFHAGYLLYDGDFVAGSI